MEFHPVVWLHIPLRPETAAVDNFPDWDEAANPLILSAAVERLGGKTYGKTPNGLHYPYECKTSRMYCARAESCVNTATILSKTTC